MNGFHYKCIKGIQDCIAQVHLTDVDSFYYIIKTENIYGEFYKHKDLFDFRSHSKDPKFYDNTNNLVFGKMKDEKYGAP